MLHGAILISKYVIYNAPYLLQIILSLLMHLEEKVSKNILFFQFIHITSIQKIHIDSLPGHKQCSSPSRWKHNPITAIHCGQFNNRGKIYEQRQHIRKTVWSCKHSATYVSEICRIFNTIILGVKENTIKPTKCLITLSFTNIISTVKML